MTLLTLLMNKKRFRLPTSLILGLLLLFSQPTWTFSPYSNSELDELEKKFIQQINQSDNVIRIPLANQYINHLGKMLAFHGQLKAPVFFLVNSSQINAFAGPGGYIGVNSQLILASDTESELAAVMAHEMAHVRQHHLYRMIEHEKQMQIPMLASMLASIALGVINPALGSGALMGSLTGFAQDNINFVRSNEKEADRIGINMLIKSGLDPRGMAGFFKKMQQSTRYYYTENIPAILRTHPLDDDRIAEAENRCLHVSAKSYPDHLDYHLFKELIRNATTPDSKTLLGWYPQECQKHNSREACEYGYVLTLLSINQYAEARTHLLPLLNQDHDHLFYAIAMAQADTGSQQYASAIARLKELQANYPDNYATVIEYAQVLLAANKAEQAAALLLKGSRQFRDDLPICHLLARAEAQSHRKDYAYFTSAQCHMLQGENRAAMGQLKLAKTMVGKDHLLLARINARMDEIKAAKDQ
jgi:predicted Zn-dependent protease